jgi:hypothetical protein
VLPPNKRLHPTRTAALPHRGAILHRVAVRAGEPQIRWASLGAVMKKARSRTRNSWKPWGDHPVVVTIVVTSCLIGALNFFFNLQTQSGPTERQAQATGSHPPATGLPRPPIEGTEGSDARFRPHVPEHSSMVDSAELVALLEHRAEKVLTALSAAEEDAIASIRSGRGSSSEEDIRHEYVAVRAEFLELHRENIAAIKSGHLLWGIRESSG